MSTSPPLLHYPHLPGIILLLGTFVLFNSSLTSKGSRERGAAKVSYDTCPEKSPGLCQTAFHYSVLPHSPRFPAETGMLCVFGGLSAVPAQGRQRGEGSEPVLAPAPLHALSIQSPSSLQQGSQTKAQPVHPTLNAQLKWGIFTGH